MVKINSTDGHLEDRLPIIYRHIRRHLRRREMSETPTFDLAMLNLPMSCWY